MSIIIKEIIVKTTIEQGKKVDTDDIYRKLKQSIEKEVTKQLKLKTTRENR